MSERARIRLRSDHAAKLAGFLAATDTADLLAAGDAFGRGLVESIVRRVSTFLAGRACPKKHGGGGR